MRMVGGAVANGVAGLWLYTEASSSGDPATTAGCACLKRSGRPPLFEPYIDVILFTVMFS